MVALLRFRFDVVLAFVAPRAALVAENLILRQQPKACCERVGTLRRDCFDHIIVKDEHHVQRVLRNYVTHYHGRPTEASACNRPTAADTCHHPGRPRVLASLQPRSSAAWRARADKAGRPIRWTFTVKDARRVFRYDGIVTRRSKH